MSEQRDDAIDHVTAQPWVPELREDGVYLVAANDRTPIAKLCRPDRGSDLILAGYIAGLQRPKVRAQPPRADLRTCTGCGRSYALLHICERCGQCDALDLPRDADRSAPCCLDDTCVERDWRKESP